MRGVEVVYFEFKEALVDLALHKLRNILDPKGTAKTKGLVARFLEDHLLKRIGALIRHTKSKNEQSSISMIARVPSRVWPESEKDRVIREKMEERRKQEEEERSRIE